MLQIFPFPAPYKAMSALLFVRILLSERSELAVRE
ncbi:hypothetical protein SCG7086_AJ_00050 [Chlamydiales bacterium SCGC AG-110-P3]|nr:hypothetical protein SCG7086_AJ_00050 [Chlamydiales bacterium SCGC AG-110-P3]